MNYKTLLVALVAAALVVAPGCGSKESTTETPKAETAAGPVTKVDPATAAAVSGKVNFTGKAPARARLIMDAEPDCKGLHTAPVLSEEVIVNANGTLANVFVYVKAGLEGKTFEMPSGPANLDQKGCVYRPHVFGVRAGQVLSVSNSDPTTHNIHPMPRTNREWNTSQPPKGANIERTFPRPEVMIPVKCNVHPWMKSYVGVLDHPYFAVTGEDGSFTIANLPPGDYSIEAWHEKYPAQEQKVTLAAGAKQTLEFTFKGD
jgi:plastocyanin